MIPVVADYGDHSLAQKAAERTKRWFWGHLISGVAFSYSVVVACCLAFVLHEQAVAWAVISVPFIAVGAGLLAVGMGADGIGPLAIRKSGYPAQLFFDGSRMWVTGTFIAGSVIFGLG